MHQVVDHGPTDVLFTENLPVLAMVGMIGNQDLFDKFLESLSDRLDQTCVLVLDASDSHDEFDKLEAAHLVARVVALVLTLRHHLDEGSIDCVFKDNFAVQKSHVFRHFFCAVVP